MSQACCRSSGVRDNCGWAGLVSQAGCRSSGVRVNCGWAGLVSQAGCRSSGVRVNCGWAGLVSQAGCRSSGVRVNCGWAGLVSQAGCRSSGVRVNCGWAGLVSQAGCRSSGVRVNMSLPHCYSQLLLWKTEQFYCLLSCLVTTVLLLTHSIYYKQLKDILKIYNKVCWRNSTFSLQRSWNIPKLKTNRCNKNPNFKVFSTNNRHNNRITAEIYPQVACIRNIINCYKTAHFFFYQDLKTYQTKINLCKKNLSFKVLSTNNREMNRNHNADLSTSCLLEKHYKL